MNRNLLEEIKVKNELASHLLAIKAYLFYENSDFATAFFAASEFVFSYFLFSAPLILICFFRNKKKRIE